MPREALDGPREALGARRAYFAVICDGRGRARAALGGPRAAVGMARAAVGMARAAVGGPRAAVGVARAAVGMARAAVGEAREAPGRSRALLVVAREDLVAARATGERHERAVLVLDARTVRGADGAHERETVPGARRLRGGLGVALAAACEDAQEHRPGRQIACEARRAHGDGIGPPGTSDPSWSGHPADRTLFDERRPLPPWARPPVAGASRRKRCERLQGAHRRRPHDRQFPAQTCPRTVVSSRHAAC